MFHAFLYQNHRFQDFFKFGPSNGSLTILNEFLVLFYTLWLNIIPFPSIKLVLWIYFHFWPFWAHCGGPNSIFVHMYICPKSGCLVQKWTKMDMFQTLSYSLGNMLIQIFNYIHFFGQSDFCDNHLYLDKAIILASVLCLLSELCHQQCLLSNLCYKHCT